MIGLAQWFALWVMVVLCVAMFATSAKDCIEGREAPFYVACAISGTMICVVVWGFSEVLS